MATDPAFAATPIIGSATLTAIETRSDVPTQAVTIVTAGASGTKIEEIVVNAVSNGVSLAPITAAGLVYIFVVLDSGPTYHLYDTLIVSAITGSATSAPFRTNKQYPNLTLATGYSLRASTTVAPSSQTQNLKVTAAGGNL